MLRNIVIHADYSTPAKDLFLLKNHLKRNKIEFIDAFYQEEYQVKSFFAGMTTSFIKYLSDNNIVISCPLKDIVMTAIDGSNQQVIRVGKDSILQAITYG